MLDILSGMELVDRKSDGTVYFTASGRELADALWHNAESISTKLRPALQLSADAADECALLLLDAVQNSAAMSEIITTDGTISGNESDGT